MQTTTATSQTEVVRAHRRFGPAQVIAGLLLLAFVCQGLWLGLRTPLDRVEEIFARPTPPEAAGQSSAVMSSPVTVWPARVAGAALRLKAGETDWAMRLPFLFFGAMLGASLWYVARRLYGNIGGYVALALYSFSPTMLSYSARVQPEIVVAWGVFGCVFTAIATAHTLYAPREVVLWNWRRISLLGMAIGVAASARFAAVLALPIALAFMLYLAPERRAATLAIMAAGSTLGILVFAGLHAFDISSIAAAVAGSAFTHPVWSGVFSLRVWGVIAQMLWQNGVGLVLLLALSLVTFAAWRRVRYFGSLAPLLAAVLMIAFGLTFPFGAGSTFVVAAFPFLFLFIAGMVADLLESRAAAVTLGIVLAGLVVNAHFSLAGLWKLR